MPDVAPFPDDPSSRDRFVLERRGPRPGRDPWRHQGVLVEEERSADGGRSRIATVFLTGSECPWRCTMCDLWQYTTATDTPPGAIPHQIAAARGEIGATHASVDGMKLYNAGSFFDPRAVPETDYDDIAAALDPVPHVIVESHPALVTNREGRIDRWRAAFAARGGRALEVAMGLETAHPGALDRLNKRLTVDGFRRAAGALIARGIAVRVFLLVSPPFVPEGEQDEWLLRSLDVAFDSGATVVSLVPTRGGNGAVEAMAAQDLFRPPVLADVERSFELALGPAGAGRRVFLDLWDLDRFASCPQCLAARRERLRRMNLEQHIAPRQRCPSCGGGEQ